MFCLTPGRSVQLSAISQQDDPLCSTAEAAADCNVGIWDVVNSPFSSVYVVYILKAVRSSN